MSAFLESFKRAQANPQAAQKFLEEQIALSNSLLMQMGPEGQTFKAAINNLQTTEISLEPSETPEHVAAYYAHNIDTGYTDQIQYSPASFKSFGQFFHARIHELVHALIYNNVAAAHAKIRNPLGPALCVEDALWENELQEHVTHAVAIYFTAKLSQLTPSSFQNEKEALESRVHVEQVLDQTGDIGKTLGIISSSLNYQDHNKKHIPDMREAYVQRSTKNLPPLDFVRLGQSDIQKLGDTYIGYNLYSGDLPLDAAGKHPPQLAWWQKLNVSMTSYIIQDKKKKADFPFFTEKLAQLGLTESSFIAISKGRNPPTSPTTPEPKDP